MSTYSYVREECVQGVLRGSMPNPMPLDRIRSIFDGAFFSINSSVANAFAAKQDSREMLRVATSTVTFTAGSATLPSNVLQKFIPDATFLVIGKKYSFRRYPDWLRGGDPRLGLWTTIDKTTLLAKTPRPVGAFTGTAAFTSICAPEVPATEDTEYDAPEDFVSDFIEAMVQYILGQAAEVAAQTA